MKATPEHLDAELRGFVGPQPPQPRANLIPRPDADGPLAVGQQAEKAPNRRVQLLLERHNGCAHARVQGGRLMLGNRHATR